MKLFKYKPKKASSQNMAPSGGNEGGDPEMRPPIAFYEFLPHNLWVSQTLNTPQAEDPTSTVKCLTHSLPEEPVWVCDLDGTLIHGDLFAEKLMSTAFRRPLHLIGLTREWIKYGKSGAKHYLFSTSTKFDPSTLPYRKETLQLLRNGKEMGRTLILATGAPDSIAQEVKNYLGLFDHALGSTQSNNLTGKTKGTQVTHYLEKAELPASWSYFGNDKSDLEVWKFSNSAVVFGSKKLAVLQSKTGKPIFSNKFLNPQLRSQIKPLQTSALSSTHDTLNILKAHLKTMRPHQWTKNLLIFFPFLLYHHYSPSDLKILITGFIAFSLLASSVYVCNDLADVELDRKNPTKKHRPIAAGTLPIGHAIGLALLLLTLGFSLGATLGTHALYSLCIYFLISMTYSSFLKRLLIIDIVILSSLYLIRLFFGHLLVGIPFSYWLSSFCVFQFFTLALIKRCSELNSLDGQEQGRAYRKSDLQILKPLGVACSLVSVLIYALYINGPEVQLRYQYPYALGVVGACILIMNLRIWIFAERGEVKEDPVVFVLKDKTFWILSTISLLTLIVSSKWFTLIF